MNQAIVPLYCDTYGNFFISEVFLYTIRNGEPLLLARLPENIVERDYKKYYPDGFTWAIKRVEANKGKLIIHKSADGSHACPESSVRFDYAWNGESFVLAGTQVEAPLNNCGVQEERKHHQHRLFLRLYQHRRTPTTKRKISVTTIYNSFK